MQKNYLIQQYAISPSYAQAIYDLLPADEKRAGYTMEEVADGAKEAHLVGKNVTFASESGRGFMGMPVPTKSV